MAESSISSSEATEVLSFEQYFEFTQRHYEKNRQKAKKIQNDLAGLSDIGDRIIAKEDLLVQERKEWMARYQHLRSSDMNLYFIKLCKLETQFYDLHFKKLYDERRDLARKITCFWRNAMINNNKLYYKIRRKDLRPLAYLYDIRSERTSDKKGFKLEFFFDADENPYFSNKSLTKMYELLEGSISFVLLKATGTKIDWKPSKNVTEMGGGSFFNFFKSCIIAPVDDPLWFDMEADELKGDLPEDFVIGRKIRDKIVRNATSWFFSTVENDSDFSEADDIVDMGTDSWSLRQWKTDEEGQGP